jgi:hypothetical protein
LISDSVGKERDNLLVKVAEHIVTLIANPWVLVMREPKNGFLSAG